MKSPRWQPISGKNIDRVKHDNGNLTVKFSNGRTYTYAQVPREKYIALLRHNIADDKSAGTYFLNNIRGKHEFKEEQY